MPKVKNILLVKSGALGMSEVYIPTKAHAHMKITVLETPLISTLTPDISTAPHMSYMRRRKTQCHECIEVRR